MGLKTKVKAGNITNLSDARYCAGMGVDWLGFPVSGIDPKTLEEITQWVTGPQFVLELTDEKNADLTPYPVSVLQIPVSRLDEFDGNHSLIVELPLHHWNEVQDKLIVARGKILGLLITRVDVSSTASRQLLQEISNKFKILVHLDSATPLESVLSLPVEGINVSGKQELKPGLQDYTQLAAVFDQLEVD